MTLVEFADPQCPFCRDYTADVMPGLIEKYVKSGDVRMELNLLTFIGADSENLARGGLCRRRTRTGCGSSWTSPTPARSRRTPATPTRRSSTGSPRPPGVDAAEMNSAADSDAVTKQLETAKAAAAKAGVDSTPTFLVGPTGGDLKPVEQADLAAAIDQQLAAAK